MRKLLARLLAVALCVQLTTGGLIGQSRKKLRPKQPPQQWSKADLDPFFSNVFDSVGPGPPGSNGGRGTPIPIPGIPEDPGGGNNGGGGSGAGWSAIVSAQTLEDEIKTAVIQVGPAVASPTKFNTQHREARRIYSSVAVVFGVIADYDQDVRFKNAAAGMRDKVARAGFNSKVNTTGAFNEAKQRYLDLQDLVRGGNVALPEAETRISFAKVADRPPLMQRMDLAFEKTLKPMTSNINEFKANIDTVKREAEMLGMLAKVIQDQSYEYAEGEDYLEYCKAIEQNCKEIVDGIKLNAFEQVERAVGNIFKSCTNCHEGYRS